MKVVILAAGLGSRLRKDKSELPKPLTKLNDNESILEKQVNNLDRYFDLNKVIMIVGYKLHLIMEEYPDFMYVYNQDFSTNNTSKSLLKALRKIENEPVLWMNGDVICDHQLFETLLPHIAKGESFVAVNNSQVSEEEVKYTLDEQGFIKALNKQIPTDQALGEAIGINFIALKDLETFKRCLEKCDDNDYFERGIEYAIEEKCKIIPVNISSHFCMEVDFQEDLELANKSIDEK